MAAWNSEKKYIHKSQKHCAMFCKILKYMQSVVNELKHTNIHWHSLLSRHIRQTWKGCRLDLMLTYYITFSVSIIDKCHISRIIQHNAYCTTPVIQVLSLRFPWKLLQRRDLYFIIYCCNHQEKIVRDQK